MSHFAVVLRDESVKSISLAAALALSSCASDPAPPPARTLAPTTTVDAIAPSSSPPPAHLVASAKAEPVAVSAPIVIDRTRYAFLDADGAPAAVDTLDARLAPPDGFTRVALERGSFGAWLRGLPLAAAGTPVTSFRGGVVLPADHENLAAVVALDIGHADLQQCADSVIRLHAEWSWQRGGDARAKLAYRAASGTELPLARWLAGDRVGVKDGGRAIEWLPGQARASNDHTAFRAYLDAVFAWANTVSLARDATPSSIEALAPGAFVVMPGGPGHAVLVLDVATREDGTRALLLGQGFMPAQSFQVLRPSRASAWFLVEPGSTELVTPFWRPFPWALLRRFPGA